MAAKCITFRRKTKDGPRLSKPVTVCFKRKVSKRKQQKLRGKKKSKGLSPNVCRARDGKFMRCTGPARGFALPGVGLLRNEF